MSLTLRLVRSKRDVLIQTVSFFWTFYVRYRDYAQAHIFRFHNRPSLEENYRQFLDILFEHELKPQMEDGKRWSPGSR